MTSLASNLDTQQGKRFERTKEQATAQRGGIVNEISLLFYSILEERCDRQGVVNWLGEGEWEPWDTTTQLVAIIDQLVGRPRDLNKHWFP